MGKPADDPLKCSYIDAPCVYHGTPICATKSTIACRNIRQKNEQKEEANVQIHQGRPE